jgi:SAM-dependent methyltransferase
MPTRDRFLDAYDGAPPPWDIGRPQPDLVALFDELALSGSALDLGCGTGENALELARRGLDAWGLDATPAAIAAAEKKRDARGLSVRFVIGDALEPESLGRTFDAVLDCGLFHVLTDEERAVYAKKLPLVLPKGGRFIMLGFATNTSGQGPRGYSADELRGYFDAGWREGFIRETAFEATGQVGTRAAWLSLFVRE